jgi:hypothetical protein
MKEWLSLFETFVWVGLAGHVIYRFGGHLEGLLEAFQARVKSGSSVKAGPFEFGEDLKLLRRSHNRPKYYLCRFLTIGQRSAMASIRRTLDCS